MKTFLKIYEFSTCLNEEHIFNFNIFTALIVITGLLVGINLVIIIFKFFEDQTISQNRKELILTFIYLTDDISVMAAAMVSIPLRMYLG